MWLQKGAKFYFKLPYRLPMRLLPHGLLIISTRLINDPLPIAFMAIQLLGIWSRFHSWINFYSSIIPLNLATFDCSPPPPPQREPLIFNLMYAHADDAYTHSHTQWPPILIYKHMHTYIHTLTNQRQCWQCGKPHPVTGRTPLRY